MSSQFEQVVQAVRSFDKNGPVKSNQSQQLSMYSLFKQATEGDVSTPRPGMLDFTGRSKWDAWNKVKGMSKEDAEKEYIRVFWELVNPVKGAYLLTRRSQDRFCYQGHPPVISSNLIRHHRILAVVPCEHQLHPQARRQRRPGQVVPGIPAQPRAVRHGQSLRRPAHSFVSRARVGRG